MQEVKFASDVVRILQSILTKRIQKNNITSSRLALEAILDNVGTAIYVTDIETGEKIYVNDKLQRQFVMELQDGTFPQLLQQAMEHTRPDGTHEFYHADVEHWYNVVYREMTWVDGHHANVYVMRDITDAKEYEKRLELQSQTDYLTGLFNRTCLERELEKCIEDAKRLEQNGALLYMDLDDFKRINDGLGHQYGDEVLKSISESLKKIEEIRKTCYRMGGDEFVIIVPAKYAGRLEKIKNSILDIFRQTWYLKDANHTCTMSMGIVTFPDSGDTVTELLKKVDLAVYDAKRSGKNKIVTYENGPDSESHRRWDMEQNMRAAIADNFRQFEVLYQPIMEIHEVTNNCIGAEALLRWNSKALGEVPVAEFLPLAEHLGLINSIGNYVLHTACTTCKKWNDNGNPGFKVCVNLSVVQLLQTDIVEIIDETVKATGIIPENLILDVKEDLAVSDLERMKDILQGIRSLGVQVALDDFGTGVSSMNHVRDLPFDMVKVGQDFTQNLSSDTYVQFFVQMLDRVGSALGIHACVEGIETTEQLETLRLLRVRYAQGYYLGKPTDKDEFEEKYVVSVEFI
jgi:diguanylate cyclase (GGDEF)-like protein